MSRRPGGGCGRSSTPTGRRDAPDARDPGQRPGRSRPGGPDL